MCPCNCGWTSAQRISKKSWEPTALGILLAVGVLGSASCVCGVVCLCRQTKVYACHYLCGLVCAHLCDVYAQQCVCSSVCTIVCSLSYLYVRADKDERCVRVQLCSPARKSDYLSTRFGFYKPSLLLPTANKCVHPIPHHPWEDPGSPA